MFSKEIFGERVSEVRKLHGETQKELGAAIGMSSNNISEIEKGKKTTISEKLVKICRHYHVSADYLLGLSDDMRGGADRWTEEDEPQ